MRPTSNPWRKLSVLNGQRGASKQRQNRKQSHSAYERFSSRVSELLPSAVKRSLERPKKNEFKTVDPRAPQNKIVLHEDGERYVVGKGGSLIPLYRDWEKMFGKPRGDNRPYYRKYMGPLLMPYEEQPGLESMKSLIVVEGLGDWIAVKKAINAPIFVCDGTSILDHIYEKYVKRIVSEFDRDVVILMDPDTAGRRMRTSMSTLITPSQHAFVSEYEAVVGMGTAYESVGVQHCFPATIQKALKDLKEYTPFEENNQRIAFDHLYDLGLVQTPAENTEGVRLRRRFFCGLLGIGFCDGKQLIKQLNRYNFSDHEIEFARARADVLVKEWTLKPWKLQKDFGRSQTQKKNTFRITNNFIAAF